jgi:hypothetical protein
MFMRHPAYRGEDSGSQAIAGESSRILKQSWANPKIISQTVSHWLSLTPNSLLHTQLELEARVGIGQVRALSAVFKTHPQCLRHQRHAASKLSNIPIDRHFRRVVKPRYYAPINHRILSNYSAKTRLLALSLDAT